ncbi:MAG: copper oxidase [Steroidobacteraceae bacterium]
MRWSRRNLFMGAGLLAGAKLLGRGHDAQAAQLPENTAAATGRVTGRGGAVPVVTLNGRTDTGSWVKGAREFHLTASEFEHEFAPGCKARCWGYNGSTPGPTLEAWEGERVRIFITNQLGEPTSVHWHGLLVPNGMDGVGGLTQEHIQPGETWVYEFVLRQNGTFMYHPHADEMTQMALGMMGMFIVHPRVAHSPPVQRDYVFLLHNWALHPGTSRPDPAVMTDFDLWTFNSKVFPVIDTLLAQRGERVRIRIGNLSMYNHPMHLHGHRFAVTGSEGGRWPQAAWLPEVTTIVGVGQTRELEFVADNPGDWALHCHMSHHTMNAMGHELPSAIGVDQSDLEARVGELLPNYMAMGQSGMFEHGEHAGMGHMKGPENTLPMMSGQGPYGAMGMGGMMTLLKVRERIVAGVDPGWYDDHNMPRARRVERGA